MAYQRKTKDVWILEGKYDDWVWGCPFPYTGG